MIAASAAGFTALKVVGGAYLTFLGVRALRAERATVEVVTPEVVARTRLVGDGFLVNLFNPKVAVFFLAFLPQFVAADHGPIWSQTLVLGMMYVVLGLCSDGMYALIGGRVGSWRTHQHRRFPCARMRTHPFHD